MGLATTRTEVVNLALASLGQKPIQNIDDDSHPARLIKPLLSETVRQIIQLIDWPDLRVTVALQEDQSEPIEAENQDPNLITFKYILPTNFLEVIRVSTVAEESISISFPTGRFRNRNRWTREGGFLFSQIPELTLTYKRYSEEPTDWEGHMMELVYRLLAANVAMSLTQSPEIASYNMGLYEQHKMQVLADAQGAAQDLLKREEIFDLRRVRRWR